MQLKINRIKFNSSIADGPGVRTVIFFQGCDIRCLHCHNKDTWDIEKGLSYSVEEVVLILEKNITNKKITISGGEPMLQKESLILLLNELKKLKYDIVLYTGHDIKDISIEILKKLNYIKTGRFIEKKRTTTQPYVGSTNQNFFKLKGGGKVI